MKISCERLTSWKLVRQLALTTVSKTSDIEPSSSWKKSILDCEHSPIRALLFRVRMENIPYFVSVHLTRHKIGVEHFVSTQRTDRTGEDRNAKRQDAPVTHEMIINAAALINMSRKRLCNLADPETREIWQVVKAEIAAIGETEMSDAMKSECQYRGSCHEMKPCKA